MTRHQQISRLPARWQGEVSYETAAKFCYLVRADSVSHTVDIHIPDLVPLMRVPAKGREQGGGCNSGLRIR